MAIDPRKRQRKAERRKAKEKDKRRALAVRRSVGMADRMAESATAPILHCFTQEELWEEGMGHVLVSRRLPLGQVAFSIFLIDMYCLGVKNAQCGIVSRSEYDEVVAKLGRAFPLEDDTPEFVRKLVEGAVDFARGLGFDPHPDYRKAQPIFGDIDPSLCTEEIEYGCDGKPRYVRGPHDSASRVGTIIRTLMRTCGPDGFDVVIMQGRGLFLEEDTAEEEVRMVGVDPA